MLTRTRKRRSIADRGEEEKSQQATTTHQNCFRVVSLCENCFASTRDTADRLCSSKAQPYGAPALGLVPAHTVRCPATVFGRALWLQKAPGRRHQHRTGAHDHVLEAGKCRAGSLCNKKSPIKRRAGDSDIFLVIEIDSD